MRRTEGRGGRSPNASTNYRFYGSYTGILVLFTRMYTCEIESKTTINPLQETPVCPNLGSSYLTKTGPKKREIVDTSGSALYWSTPLKWEHTKKSASPVIDPIEMEKHKISNTPDYKPTEIEKRTKTRYDQSYRPHWNWSTKRKSRYAISMTAL